MSTKYAVYAKYAEARFSNVLQLGLAVYFKIHCTYLLYIEYNCLYYRNVPGVYIKDLIPGSVASLDGQLKIDDRILEVNSDDLSILSQEHAANHIQVCTCQLSINSVWYQRTYILIRVIKYKKWIIFLLSACRPM